MDLETEVVDENFFTLKELAFQIIIDEFKRYSYALESTKDECLKKNLHFLQKVYSQNIIQELIKEQKLEAQHLNFLLNRHLGKLDLCSIWNLISPENIVKKVLPIAEDLTELSFRKKVSNKPSAEVRELETVVFVLSKLIPHIINVCKINILYYCTDDLLKLIASYCVQLIELDISFSRKVTYEGIRTLYTHSDGSIQAKCPLKVFCMYGSHWESNNDYVIGLLENIPTLKKLGCKDFKVTLRKIYVKYFENLTYPMIKLDNLTSIDLGNEDGGVFRYPISMYSEILRNSSKMCPNVKNLKVQVLKNKHLKYCCLFRKLEKVCIQFISRFNINGVIGLNIGSICFNIFLKMIGTNLRYMILKSGNLSLSVLLESCPNLESLRLDHISITRGDQEITKSLTYLHSLEIDTENYMSADSVKSFIPLMESPNLKNLYLIGCDLRDDDLQKSLISTFMRCKIRKLDLSYSIIEFDFLLELILNCNSLRNVSIEICKYHANNLIDLDLLNQVIKDNNRRIKINYNEKTSGYARDYRVISLFEENINFLY